MGADNAFKRRTAYYTGFYNDTDYLNVPYKSIASNRNNNGVLNSYYVVADNNNKYIPCFYPNFWLSEVNVGLNCSYFYPTSTFSVF